jgi:hypothetical protein
MFNFGAKLGQSNDVWELKAVVSAMKWKIRMAFFCGATAQLGDRPPHCWGLHITNNEIHTLGSAPLNERSARRRGCYLHNPQQTQEMNIHAVSGIRTRDRSNQAVSDLRLTPHCYRHRHCKINWIIAVFIMCTGYHTQVHVIKLGWDKLGM